MRKPFFEMKKEDWLASMVVFLVAIPLSLGIGIASGVSAEKALIAAVVGGIVVGWFAGCPLMVSGPAAGLTVLVFQTVQQYGVQALAVIVVFCGLFQILFGYFKLGALFALVPKSILNGLLSAIGFIIFVGQLHVLAGESIPGNPFEAMALLWPTFEQAVTHETHFVAPVLMCGLLAIAILLLWPNLAPKPLRSIPSALPAVIVVTLVSLNWEMDRLSVNNLIPIAQESARTFFSFEWLSQAWLFAMIGAGFALVASAESLLTARATDMMARDRDQDSGRPASDLNREVMAQGLGNMTSGLIGGLPLTGVIVRSSANIHAQAQTRWSTILHGCWVLLFVLALPGVLSLVPLTALAAILVVTGFRLLKFDQLFRTFQESYNDGVIWMFTMAAIISTNLLTGFMLALGLALMLRWSEVNVPWAAGVLVWFGLGAVISTGLLTGLILTMVFGFILNILALNPVRLWKTLRNNPKRLPEILRVEEPSGS